MIPNTVVNPDYELACESNVTLVYLNSQKYRVKAINYTNFTIRLVDVSMNNNICSFPYYSAYPYNFTDGYPYDTMSFSKIARHINLMSCPYPLKNSSLLTELPTDCGKGDGSSRHTYIKVGNMNVTEVKDLCRIELIVMTSWMFKDLKNVSFSEIHNSLLYGFELSWLSFRCGKCNGVFSCPNIDGDLVACRKQDLRARLEALWYNIYNSSDGPGGLKAAVILITLLIIVAFFTGVSIPAKIIIGIFCAWGFITVEMNGAHFNTLWHISHLPLIIGLFFAIRFIIVLPCMMWFWINKFRRRNMSTYDAIEDFLQRDNHLMPIRYSYSDIKKMTRDFREKLGQGGYGTVYKGKLRSGYDVAVKLLG
ncbi:hypothetical protein ACS0TY_028088 [Phlomoides rotata]